jgi:hypothetical protein
MLKKNLVIGNLELGMNRRGFWNKFLIPDFNLYTR